MYEYKTFIICINPVEAEFQLNSFAREGWRVVSVCHNDRVLMERAIPGSGYDAPPKPATSRWL